jgi:hypothetical protein
MTGNRRKITVGRTNLAPKTTTGGRISVGRTTRDGVIINDPTTILVETIIDDRRVIQVGRSINAQMVTSAAMIVDARRLIREKTTGIGPIWISSAMNKEVDPWISGGKRINRRTWISAGKTAFNASKILPRTAKAVMTRSVRRKRKNGVSRTSNIAVKEPLPLEP